jgi:nitrite reductase/ring-hydroxylating ferredoxin subunit
MLYFYCAIALTYIINTSAYNYLPHIKRMFKKVVFPVKYNVPDLKAEDFPLPPFPNTWYPVCFEKDIKKGKTYPFRIAGQDIILFRNENNSIRGVDRFCKHNGVDLTYGKINDKCIVCPFHKKKMFGNLPIDVTNGLVFLWNGSVNDKKQPPFTMKQLIHDCDVKNIEPVRNFQFKTKLGGHMIDHTEQLFDFKHAIHIHGQDITTNNWNILDNNHSYKVTFDSWEFKSSMFTIVTPTVWILQFIPDCPTFIFFYVTDVGKIEAVFTPAKTPNMKLKHFIQSLIISVYTFIDGSDESAYLTTKNHHQRNLDSSEHKMVAFREWFKNVYYDENI